MSEEEKAEEKKLLSKSPNPCVTNQTNLAELLTCCSAVYFCTLLDRTQEKENRTKGVLR